MILAAAAVALGAIVLYAILGGADFGGGVWDLLATGPRASRQRSAITDAIGPVWEANHVWLIFALVALFTCFPPAFAEISTGLNTPITAALIGIVLRGAAFVFRNYAGDAPVQARTWSIVFGASSIVAPFMLGDAAGALATGTFAWTSPFAFAVGAFGTALCAQVAAVFLLRERDVLADATLRADFQRRAVRATLAVWALGLLPAAIARISDPRLMAALTRPSAFAAIATAMALGVVVIVLVARGAGVAARYAVGAEVAAILAGWFGAQAPALIPGRMTLSEAAASDAMLGAFLVVAALGALVLIPSLALLFRVFKGPLSAP